MPDAAMSELTASIRAQARERGLMIQMDGPEQEMIPVAL